MKAIRVIIASILIAMGYQVQAQNFNYNYEHYGHTLNSGIGLVYFGYVGQTVPVVHFNYEIEVAKDFTLAPFISYFAYTEYRYGGAPGEPKRNYYYRQSVMPVGGKASYYFDDILNASYKWDFYASASLGFAIRKTVWEDGYYGNRDISRQAGGLYADLHVGTEYHLNRKFGLFADLSTGISTFGLAAHF
jgi:hypothetical protein